MLKPMLLAGMIGLIPHWVYAQFDLPMTLICEQCNPEEVEAEMVRFCSNLEPDESGGIALMDAGSEVISRYDCDNGSVNNYTVAATDELAQTFAQYLSHWRSLTESLKQGHQLRSNEIFDALQGALENREAFEETLYFSLMKDPVFANHVQGVSNALNSIRKLRKMPALMKLFSELEPFEASVVLADGGALPFTLCFLSTNKVIFEVKVQFDRSQ